MNGRPTYRRRSRRLETALALALLAALSCGAQEVGLMPSSALAQKTQQSPQPLRDAHAAAKRTLYQLNLALDFDKRSYTGTERVRWTNRDHRPTSLLYFHLYPNHRGEAAAIRPLSSFSPTLNGVTDAPAQTSPAQTSPTPSTQDEPRLDVTEVRSGSTAQPLPFSLDETGVTMRVQLRDAVQPGASTEIEISFRGTLPEVSADETSLPAHVVQQVGAALRDTREWRRGRDTNFYSRGVIMLGAAYPVLAVRDGDDWQRKVEASVGDTLHTEVADYQVRIAAAPGVALFTSGEPAGGSGGGGDSDPNQPVEHNFEGTDLRSFAILAGRTLRAAERTVSGVRVRSVYSAEHETVGRRVLSLASEAVRVFVARFGELPFKSITIAEAPLVAGLGSAEYAGLSVIASAFYVDFDAAATRNLPEIVREQRASVEDSLEFTVAHMAAHQWWGISVGNDPERAPVLDEAMAHWSALLYYKDVHGEARAAQALDDQLRGVYQIYRTFGGEDMAAERSARDYRNSFQYAAIVASKGSLMFPALRRLLGEERFWKALRNYYEANRLEIAELGDLEAAFVAEVPPGERRAVTRAFDRWLSQKRGDEDIAPPNPQLAAALGINNEQNSGARDRNALSRLGRFFWRQMTRIR